MKTKEKLQPKKLSAWLLAGWLVAMWLDYLLPHPINVIRCDPATLTGSILIGMAISAATTAAEVGFQAIMASRQKKPNPIDRGKLDDARVSTAGFNEVIFKAWGKFRGAPIWIWHSPIIHSTTTETTGGGGKGFLSPHIPTPENINHIYTSSLMGVFHDGVVYNGAQRVWFNTELVYNGLLYQNAALFREAEFAQLAGGANVVSAATCSNGRKVTGLGSGGKATFSANVTNSGAYEFAVGYLSTTDLTFKIKVNGGVAVDLVCTASGGSTVVAIQSIQLTLSAGPNTIEFGNAGAPAPDLDRIQISPVLVFDDGEDPRAFTGGIDPNKVYPPNPYHSWAFQNESAIPIGSGGGDGGGNGLGNAGGASAVTLAKWGSPQLRVYAGLPDQPIDSAVLANKGVGNASAYRNYGLLMIDGIQLQNGALPNVTIEADQGTRDVQTMVGDLYALCGVNRSKLNVAALAGLIVGDVDAFNVGTYAAITWANLTNTTAGSGGAISKTSGTNNTYNAGAAVASTLVAGTDFAIRFTAGAGIYTCGFATNSTPTNTSQMLIGIQLNIFNGKQTIQIAFSGGNTAVDVGTWSNGDEFQVEYRDGQFAVYQNGVLLTGYIPPVPVFPCYPAVIMYLTGGGPSAASKASGTNIGTRPVIVNAGALVVTSRKTAADALTDLMTLFQFDMVNVDGLETAVLRNGSPDVTIPYTDMRAHAFGEAMPEFDAEITDMDPLALPREVLVNYSDPQFDYHTCVQSDMLLSGPQFDVQNISLSVVEAQDNIKRLATTLLNKAHMESRSFRFFTGPKWGHVFPGTIATLVMPNATHIARCISAKVQLPAGKCEFEFVRHKASIYSPTATGSGAIDPPNVQIVGNARGVIIDGPLLRPEDAGDGTEPVVYVGTCLQGSGTFTGGFLIQESPVGSNLYKLLTSFDQQTNIGVTGGTLASVSDPSVLDMVSSLVVNFYTDAELTSAVFADLTNNPTLNLIAVINPSTNQVEYLQFADATPSAATAPYKSRYTLSTFLRGKFGTDSNVGVHTSADDVVVMDSTLKPRRMPVSFMGRAINFKFMSSGQLPADAATKTQTLNGSSILPLSPVSLRGVRDNAGNLDIEWNRRGRLGGGLRDFTDVPIGEDDEAYDVEIYNGATLKRTYNIRSLRSHPVTWFDYINPSQPQFLQQRTNTPLDPYESFFEFTVTSDDGSGGPAGGSVAGGLSHRGYIFQRWSWTFSGTAYSVAEYDELGTLLGSASGAVPPNPVDPILAQQITRYRFEIRDGHVNFYIDYLNDGSVPVYRGLGRLDGTQLFPSVVDLNTGLDNTHFSKAMMRDLPNHIFYPVALQVADFGAAQNPVPVKVYMVSATLGRGAAASASI